MQYQSSDRKTAETKRKRARDRYKAREQFIVEGDQCAALVMDGVKGKGGVVVDGGLYDGLAGSGYLFLTLTDVTHRSEYKKVALSYVVDAVCAMEKKKKNGGLTTIDCSLFEGVAGRICFLSDVMVNQGDCCKSEGDSGLCVSYCFPCFQLQAHEVAPHQ